MYRILLVEDDKRIRDVITEYFAMKEADVFQFTIAKDGTEAMEWLYESDFDMVLLDIMLPGLNGFEICREIRMASDMPIIFLTAMGQEADIIHGYDLGCDDYIVKPFSIAVLDKKMKALLNRVKGTILSEELKAGTVTLNPRTLQVKIGGEEIVLPPKQYMMLKILMENKNSVVSRENLLVRIWGYDYEGNERVLDNHMKKLRKALGSEGDRIRTAIGRGYKMVD